MYEYRRRCRTREVTLISLKVLWQS